MLDRVNKLLKNKIGGNVLGGTFHSFANYILRSYSNVIGIKNNFTIIDTTDSADIFSLLKYELKINKKLMEAFPYKNELQEITTKARNLETPITKVIEEFFINILIIQMR